MHILITNDDGIEAAGLEALLAVATQFGAVTVVAPHTHQSAQSHAITLTVPLVAHEFCFDAFPDVRAIGLEGHPADCVRLAMRNLLEVPVDLVLSGINSGANVGMNIHYSGTVGAAAEAAMYAIPAVAFSVATPFAKEDRPDMTAAIEPCTALLGKLIEAGIKPGDLININLPNQFHHPTPKAVRVCRQSQARVRDTYREERTDDAGRRFHIGDKFEFDNPSPDTDIELLRAGHITITPITIDNTDHGEIGRFETLFS